MTRLTQELRDEITGSMLGILDRFSDLDRVDMPRLAHRLAAECFRTVEALERGRTRRAFLCPVGAIVPIVQPPLTAVSDQIEGFQ